jgi:hypothetical protein
MMKRGHDVESAPGIWRRKTAMEHYAGIDVSLERSSVCVVDALGKIVKEAKISSEPAALADLGPFPNFATFNEQQHNTNILGPMPARSRRGSSLLPARPPGERIDAEQARSLEG